MNPTHDAGLGLLYATQRLRRLRDGESYHVLYPDCTGDGLDHDADLSALAAAYLAERDALDSLPELDADTDSPLRDADPDLWNVHRCVEFAELMPLATYDNAFTASQGWICLRLLAKWVRGGRVFAETPPEPETA